MSRSLSLFSLGIFFLLVAAGLLALTWEKPAKPARAAPNKSERRELAAREQETRKLRLGAGIMAALGVLFMLIS